MQADGVAVVTGASRGIGRAVALELAARGFDVVATMREPRPELADEARGRLRVERFDVTAPGTFTMPDGLRVLVNNAAVEQPHLPVEETPLRDWREMFETNVFGLVEATRLAIPALRASGGGVICNVTSSSILAPVPFYAVYRASKAAVSAIGETLRAELAPFGIRIVEIMPGPIDTDMLATSEHTMLAVNYAAYRPMAERMVASRAGATASTTSPAEAAHAIADAVLDDDGPLRHGCDPLGTGLLEAWRQAPDEQMMRTMDAGLSGMLG